LSVSKSIDRTNETVGNKFVNVEIPVKCFVFFVMEVDIAVAVRSDVFMQMRRIGQ